MAEALRLIQFLGSLQKEGSAVFLMKSLRRINTLEGKDLIWSGIISSERVSSGVGMSQVANEILAASKAKDIDLETEVVGIVSMEERYSTVLKVFKW